MEDKHEVFVQYWDGETFTTHAFYNENTYFENTDDRDNGNKVHKIIYYGKKLRFDTVGDFRFWLRCMSKQIEQLSLF